MNRLKQTNFSGVDICACRQPKASAHHGRQIAQDIPEEIAGDQDVELFRSSDDLHCGAVHEHIGGLDLWEFLGNGP